MSLNWGSMKVIRIDDSETFSLYSEPANIIPQTKEESTYEKTIWKVLAILAVGALATVFIVRCTWNY